MKTLNKAFRHDTQNEKRIRLLQKFVESNRRSVWRLTSRTLQNIECGGTAIGGNRRLTVEFGRLYTDYLKIFRYLGYYSFPLSCFVKFLFYCKRCHIYMINISFNAYLVILSHKVVIIFITFYNRCNWLVIQTYNLQSPEVT